MSDPDALLPRTALHPYQTVGAASLLSADGRQLVAIMGAGKTIVALTAISDLQTADSLGDGIIVVVGPLAVVQTVWHREAANWEHTRHLRVERVLGTAKQRQAALERPADVYAVNYDNVRWFADEIAKRGLPIALLIADEASCLKTPSAHRTKVMIELGHRAAKRWALTGTPRNHMLLDVWGPAQYLTREQIFPPFAPWRDTHFFSIDIYARHWVPRAGVEPVVTTAIRQFTHVVDQAALCTRPPMVEVIHDIVLPLSAVELYDSLDAGTTATLAAAVAAGIASPPEMALVTKLQQVCSGAIYTSDGDGKFSVLHDLRLDALADIHDGHSRPTLVFVQYRHEIVRILERFPFASELSSTLIDPWNRSEIPMLVAHPASAGHGINLQHGSDVVVWFGGTGWSAELWAQANARLARQGQASTTVTVHVLLCRDRIDEVAYHIVKQRVREQDRLVEALR
jgi:SNF2 family DNA or RNA helicase